MEPVMGVGSNIVIRGGLQGWSGMGKGTRSAMALAEGGGGLGVGVRVAAQSGMADRRLGQLRRQD